MPMSVKSLPSRLQLYYHRTYVILLSKESTIFLLSSVFKSYEIFPGRLLSILLVQYANRCSWPFKKLKNSWNPDAKFDNSFQIKCGSKFAEGKTSVGEMNGKIKTVINLRLLHSLSAERVQNGLVFWSSLIIFRCFEEI